MIYVVKEKNNQIKMATNNIKNVAILLECDEDTAKTYCYLGSVVNGYKCSRMLTAKEAMED